MKREDVIVKPGHAFDHFFPKAKLITVTKKKGAKVEDTLRLIPWVIRETAFHTRRFAKEYILASTVKASCERLWHFVYDHIAYKKDEDGKEQVRSPARTWHDRHNRGPNGEQMGVDCDCMTVFLVSVLYNLGIQNIVFRITKYSSDHFEHIYPVVFLPDGEQITLDCVTHQFNYEEPYTEKKDTTMDLEYLNGVSDLAIQRLTDSTDFLGIMEEQEAFDQLGKILRKAKNESAPAAKKPIVTIKKPTIQLPKPKLNIQLPVVKKIAEQKKLPVIKKDTVKKAIGQGLHVQNRINPVTVALRNGILAGMKLNFMQIGSNLRWAYLQEDDAVKQGADRVRFRKLKTVREKLETIFHGAGGKKENLKNAILTGKGNSDKAVPMNGLGSISYSAINGLHEDMPLRQLLGRDIYQSENVDDMAGFLGFKGLGEVTAASIAAASSALTAIAGLIKSIGAVFPNKRQAPVNKPEAPPPAADTTPADTPATETPGSGAGSGSGNQQQPSASRPAPGNGGGDENPGSGAGSRSNNTGPAGETEQAPAAASGDNQGKGGDKIPLSSKARAFWEKNKSVLKPAGFVAGTLGLLYLAYRLLKPKKKKDTGFSGIPKRKVSKKAAPFYSRKPAGKITKPGPHKKKSITLL